MVDAADSKSAVGDHVGVRVPPPAPIIELYGLNSRFYSLKVSFRAPQITEFVAICNNGGITGKFSGPSFIVQAAKRRPLLLGNMKIYLLSVIAKNGEKTKSRCGIARAISHLLKGVAPQIRCYSARSSTRKSGSAAWSANDLRGFSKNADVSILFHPPWDFKTKRSALMRRSA